VGFLFCFCFLYGQGHGHDIADMKIIPDKYVVECAVYLYGQLITEIMKILVYRCYVVSTLTARQQYWKLNSVLNFD
jgi:hypothetical protein